jgi:hypothetical protein
MRWKALRRRYSINAPRMIVRSRLPWPLRWAILALALGFSAALALWAFEFGKSIAGLDHGAKEELTRLRIEVAQLRGERDKAQAIANTADSLLKMEKAAQDRLALQVKQIESDNLALKADLAFFEQLLPATGTQGLSIRGLQVEPLPSGQMRYQLLLMQSGKALPDFEGSYTLTLAGTVEGRAWSQTVPGGPVPLRLKQYLRIEGVFDVPAQAVVQSVQVSVADSRGAVKATQTLKLS